MKSDNYFWAIILLVAFTLGNVCARSVDDIVCKAEPLRVDGPPSNVWPQSPTTTNVSPNPYTVVGTPTISGSRSPSPSPSPSPLIPVSNSGTTTTI